MWGRIAGLTQLMAGLSSTSARLKELFDEDGLDPAQKNTIQPIYFIAFKMKKRALRMCVLDVMKESYPEFTKNLPVD
jgi:hypothetical protein